MSHRAHRRRSRRIKTVVQPQFAAFAHGPEPTHRSLGESLRFGVGTIALGAIAALAGSGSVFAQDAVATGNTIITDGRTKTTVTVNGSQTGITTATISQNTGYNSFSKFEQSAGTTVNLYLPDGTGNLVNIVRDGPVMIDGVLNSYKSGQIGGNVFFSDSHGFIVGQSGVVNVGSLTVNTPTDKFLESVIGADGTINQDAAGKLMRGEIPLSSSGFISISGVINAQNGITLDGQNVTLTGPTGSRVTADQLTQRQRFDATVNSSGLSEGGAMVSRNGVISIVAAGNANIRGKVRVGASASGKGGKINIKSGGDTTLAPTAELSADGAGKAGIGGTIVVYAGSSLFAQTGAVVSAHGAGSGAGGFVELSGKHAEIGAVVLDLLSDTGAGGTLLIDPIDVTITAGNSILNAGVNTSILADNSITIEAGGSIDTTLSGGASGDITLTAPTISVAAGGLLNAQALGGGTAGTVTLNATQATGGTAQITIAGEVRGGDVNLLASSTAAPLTILASTPTANAAVSIDGGTITASGALTARATASTAATAANLPIGVVVTNVSASVDVIGGANIQAASADLSSIATADSQIATKSLVPANSSADGAVAVSTVNSSATTHIGTADLIIAGAASLGATNTVTSHADATPVAAAFGASVAVSVVKAITEATVDASGYIRADSLSLDAISATDSVATAAATAGGASEPQAGSEAATYLDDPEYQPYESTSEGKVSVVGAFALSDLTSTTTASMTSDRASDITAGAAIRTQTSNSADVTADGSALDSNVGVGVAVGINLAKVQNNATLGGQGITAGSLDLSAQMRAGGANSFVTHTTSGAGGTSVGVAGSLAVNLVDTQSQASVTATGPVAISGGDVGIRATDDSVSTASAIPDTTGATGNVGVGASVASNIVANRTIASVANGTSISTPGSLTLSADSVHAITTTAEAGSSGGISVTPALALSLVNNTTTAQLGTGTSVQQSAGDISILASQQATENTTASGTAAGSKAAIGAAVAVALVNDRVSATTLRDLNAVGNVSLRSWGASLNTLEATASASGAEAAEENGDAAPGQDINVDSTVTSNLTHASDQQDSAGVGDSEQQQASADGAADESGRSASTGEGKVTVAAAVGVNVQTASVSAGVPDGRSITAGGALSVETANNTTGSVTTDGTAVGDTPAAVGIGAAVAVNVVHTKNDATLGDGTVNATSVTVSALKLDVAKLVAGDPADALGDTYLTSATSGAGGSKVGLAGSLALNLVDTQSQATIADNATVTLTGGDLTLSSDNETTTTATALPDETGAAGGKVGIGASVAINIVANRSTATLGDGAALNGAGGITLSASAVHDITTTAEAGSSGGVSITPVVALAMVNNTTMAQLGTQLAGVTTSGQVTIAAIQQASATTSAKGQAAGGTAAVGAALALNLVNDTVTATTNRNISAGGDVTISAAGASLNTLSAEASASGGAPADESGNAEAGQDATVDDTVDGQLSSARDQQDASGVGDAEQQGATDTAASENHSAETSQGKVTVAAGVAVNIQNATVLASVPNDISISSPTGALKILTASNTDGKATTNASAVGEEGAQAQVGIGAAVSVNVVHAVNDATLGAATHDVKSLEISASKLDVASLAANPASLATRADSYLASATSGAGGSKIGIAGALGLNLIDTQSVASIADDAIVTLHGAVSITADNQTKETAKALPVEGTAGGTFGLGASAAINIVGNRSIAKIGDNVTLNDAESLTLKAQAEHEIETEAEAGASGGVGIVPVLSLALVTNTTSATIGSDPSTLTVVGEVAVEAEQSATETTSASAKAAGSKAAVGAALSLALVTDKVVVSTGRSITATTGDVTFKAAGSSAGTLTVTAGASGAAGADSNDESSDGEGNVDDRVTGQLDFAKTTQSDSNVGDADQQAGTTETANQDHSASTSEGKLSVAAAIGVNVVTSSVSAALPDGQNITAGGRLTVLAINATDGSVTADASTADSKVSIGAAAAVNAITSSNVASLGAANYSADGVTVSALKAAPLDTPHVDTFITDAKSGAGGTTVGLAGALALNLINSSSEATVSGSAIVNANAGASTVSADQQMVANASATPVDDSATTGGKVGIGASVALNLITTDAIAEIKDGAAFNNGAGISVLANSDISTETEAKAGSEGGIAIDAVVALALLDQTTRARIGTGNAINTAGDVTIAATNSGENTATGTGEAKGGKVGVGAAVAVIAGGGDKATDLKNTSATSAELARNLMADSLEISAESTRSYEAYADASAGGGKDKEPSQTSDAESTKTLDETKNYQKGTDGSDQKTGKGGAKVTVAAAVGVAAAQDAVTATLGAVTVSLSNDLTVSARNETNIATKGDGAATGAQIGVGVGVALSISNNSATAQIADGATIARAGEINVTADSSQNMAHEAGKTDFLNGLSALAYAGASSKKVSVAGALAVDVSNTTTAALIGDNVTIGSLSRVGAVNVTADNASRMSAKSTSVARSSGQAGIGASVAVVVSDNSYTANIGAGTSLTSGAVKVAATNKKIDPTVAFNFTDLKDFQENIVNQPLFSTGNYYTEAIGGAQASKVAVQGSFSVMVFSDDTSAAIGKSLTTPASTAATSVDANGGNVTISAKNALDAKALSGGVALSSKVGVGVSSSVVSSTGKTTAQLSADGQLIDAGAVDISADGAQSIKVIGVSAAAGSNVGVAGVASVLVSDSDVEALVGAGARIAASGDVSVLANNGFDNLSVAGGLGIGGSAGIGAGVSVVTINNVTRAALADGTSAANAVQISKSGALNIAASASETGKTFAVAGGASQSVGVGVGSGTYVLDTTTEAQIGTYAQIGQSGTVGDVSVTASDDTTLDTFPGAVGIGGSVGAGAGVAVGVLGKTVSATIGDNAAVTANDVGVSAQSREAANTIALSAGVSQSAGLAGAVAVYTIENTTTARIGESAKVFANDDVAVLANDFATVDSLVGSAGVGGSAGIGASVGIVIIDNTTHAVIADLAQVTALGNGAGVTYVSDFDTSFTAFADNFQGAELPDWDSSTGLTAANASSASTVGLTAADARDTGISLLTKTRNSTAHSQTAHGVVVNAAASNAVRSLEVGFGGAGTAAVALSGNVPLITSDTQASIGAAQINKLAGAVNANQGVTVAAASDTYDLGIAGAVALGGSVGAGAGVTVAMVNSTTKATVDTGATMAAQGDVAVTARAQADFGAFSAAAAGSGTVALAGGVGVISVTDVTTAELGGTTVAGGNVQVLADDQTRVASMNGSVSVGLGAAGVGGAIGVLSINKTTTADIAANADVTALGNSANSFAGYTGTNMTSTMAARGINVAATSGESNLSIAASASGGLYAGISGVVTVQLQNITTTANIGANAQINQNVAQAGASGAQDVIVTARDTSISNVYAGGLAVGFVGLAGTVDVGVIKTTTSASVADNVTMTAKNDILVNALSNKAGNSVIVAGAAGVVSIGAAIAVYDYGNGITPGGEADDKMSDASDGKFTLNDITDQASGQTNDNSGAGVSSLFASSDTDSHVKDASTRAQTAREAITLDTAPSTGLSVPAGTSANIGRANITAGNALGVRSYDALNTTFTAGAAAAGVAGVGAGIVVQNVDTTNTAQLSGAANISSAGLTLNAQTLHALKTNAVVGAAGGFGLAAAVSVISDDSDTYAYINGANIALSGAAAVNATSTRTIDVKSLGLSFGISGAAGVSVAKASIGGQTKSALGADASGATSDQGVTIGTDVSRSASVALGASSNDGVISKTVAAGGGIGAALQGAVSTGNVTTTVATEMNAAQIYTSGAIASTVSANNSASTDAGGAALSGGLAAGVSLAHSTLKATLANDVHGGSVLDGGSVNIATTITGGSNTADAVAVAGALVGLAGSDAQSLNDSKAETNVSGSTINASGLVEIKANSTTHQTADATGYVFGIAALGSNNAKSTSATDTRATMSDMNGVTAGNLTVAANGTDSNFATAVAGSGGVVAGAASKGVTSATGTTEAYIDTSSASHKFLISVINGLVDINATHSAIFGGSVDSTQASLVGASGALMDHTVNTDVNAYLGDNAWVRAAKLSIKAASKAHNFFLGQTAYSLTDAVIPAFNADNAAWNVDSGSGGLLNLPAGKVKVSVTQDTQANVGADSDIRLLLPTAGLSLLQVEAYNELITHQKAKLDSAGAIATASSVVELGATQNATVNIGSNATLLVDVGDINIGAWNQSEMDGRSAATTYGVAGAPDGHSWANLGVANTVAIGTDARIEASDGITPADGSLPSHATVNIYAGRSPTGARSTVNLHTTIDLYNNSAIPIAGSPDAQANLTDNASVTQGTSDNTNPPPLKGILAAGNIRIGADRGDITLSAVGTGTDIYRQALAAAASAVSELFGGDEVTFDYHGGTTSNTGTGRLDLKGLVATGLQKFKSLTLNYGASCDPANVSCIVISGTIGENGIDRSTITADNSVIIQRLNQLNLLIKNTQGDTVALGAYQNEINFLEQKLIALGLGTRDASGNFSLVAYAAGKSEKQQLIDQKTATQVQLDGVTTGFTNQATVVSDALPSSIADSYDNGTANDYTSYVAATRAQAATLSAYTAAVATPATIPDGSGGTKPNPDYAAAQALIADYNTYNGNVANALSDATGYQSTIKTKQAANEALQADITGLIAIINNPSSTTAQVSTAQGQIATKLNTIVTNNTAIKTASDNLDSKMGTINTNLTNLTTRANGGAVTTGAVKNNLNVVANAKTFVDAWTTALGSVNSTVSDRVSTLTGSTPTAGSYTIATFATQASTLAATIADLNAQIPGASTAPAAAPSTPMITLHDVAARLGNIYLSGNIVTGGGTGILSAPGNAEINVTNNTAASLKVNNITMPSYDAGHVRVNDVLVNSKEDVAAFAPGQPSSSNFSQVITGLTSSRPIVTLTNNYNPTSISWPANQRGLAPPDLIVNGVVNNVDGTVDLTSEYGNIFVYGAINAGSVNILAKNGDFVSSYVNGFDHIGGDPASFNNPKSAAEAGIGIVANGAISISARYLNINSTIQSGIVDLSLNLAADPTLTALDPMQIGVSSTAIKAKSDAYRASITAGGTPSAITTVTNNQGQVITLNLNPIGLDTTALRAAITDYNEAIARDASTNPIYVIPVSGGGEPQMINIKDYISGTGVTPRLEFKIAQANAYKAATSASSLAYQVVASPGDNIGASYDVDNAEYVVNGAEVHGGYIQLYGQILNTASSGGQLNVLDGFGRINVSNASNIPLVLQTIDAGADTSGTLGRGTAGVIDITDITHVDAASLPTKVNVKHTVYTRDYVPGQASGQIMVATQTGTLDTATGIPSYAGQTLSPVAVSGADRATSYATTSNLRYIWTTSTDYRLQVNVQTKSQQLFGSSALEISSNTSFSSIGAPNVLADTRLADGTYLSQDYTPTGTTLFKASNGTIVTSSGTGASAPAILLTSPTNYTETPNSSLNFDPVTDPNNPNQLVTGDFSFSDPRSSYKQTGQSSRSCNWWTLCIDSTVTTSYLLDQYYTTIKTYALKADYPIAINFIGQNTAAVSITSPTKVTLNGPVSARNGDVEIAANGAGHSILSGDPGALVTARRVALTAGGSIGAGVTAPVQLRMDGAANGNGALIATAAAGNVNLNAPNGVLIQRVTAAGNPAAGDGHVNISVGKDIQAGQAAQFIAPNTNHPIVDTAALIQAPRVTLSAGNGAIGSIANPLQVNTGYSLANRNFGDAVNPDPEYGLSVLASGDIGITASDWGTGAQAWTGNADGTMLIDQVVSLGGDVLLDTTGQILDNNPIQTVDTRTYNELLGYWNSLGLIKGSAENTAKVQLAIDAFASGRNADYKTYWKIRQSQPDNGAAYDPTFNYTLDPTSLQYKTLVDQGVDIADYQTQLTDQYHRLNTEVGGLTSSYDAGYIYNPVDHPDDIAALKRGSTWSDRQLAFALSPGALKTVTGTNPVLKAPNVSGHTVTLNAGVGIGETIGAGTSTVGVLIPADLDPSALTDAQKIALASAERSDLMIIVDKIGALPASPNQAQIDAYNEAVRLGILNTQVTVPLGLDESAMTEIQRAALHAAANKLVAQSDLTIQVLNKRPLNFDAQTALNVDVAGTPGTLDHGTAYLASRGNGLLDSIRVPGEARIQVVGPIANVGSGIVATGNLLLEASQGGIGTGLNPLYPTGPSFAPMRLSPLSGATITARAQGDIDLDVTGSAVIDTIYSPGNVTVSADSGITNANDDQLINILGTDVVLTTTSGNIGASSRTLNVGTNFGGGITAAAPLGAIYLYGPASSSFVITSALAPNAISLSSGGAAVINGPVTTNGPLQLTVGGKLSITGNATVSTTAGNILTSAGSLQMFNGARLIASNGSVDITTDSGDALVTALSASGDVTIAATGHVLAGTDPARDFDIETTDAGALVQITSGAGIGDQTKINTTPLDWPYDGSSVTDPVSNVANALIIKTAKIALSATAGDINAITPLAITQATLSADTGSIDIAAGADFHTQSTMAGANVQIVTQGALGVDDLGAGANVNLVSHGDMNVVTLAAGTKGPGTVHLETTDGALDVGTATSTGTQTWLAKNDATFTQITTTGALPGDPGDVDVTSADGAIIGGSIDAAGSVKLTGNGIGFDTVIAGVDAAINSSKDIIGNLLDVGNVADLIAGSDTYAGDIRINVVKAKSMSFDATGVLNLPDLQVADSLVLRGGTVTAGITQVPNGPNPLRLTLTGGRGSVGTLATITANVPAGLDIGDLFFVDTTIDTTAKDVSIANAYVPGSLWVRTPLQTLLFDNRTPRPHYNANVQYFEPTYAFALDLKGYASTSDAYVVQYNVSPDATNELELLDFPGAGLVRDTIRVMRNGVDWGYGPGTPFWAFYKQQPRTSTVYTDGEKVYIDGVAHDIGLVGGQGPAVQLGSAQ
ncbi:leukotoxin LktA family filamentous adhesin [Thioclava sp. 15-R06ZXC-3]|uniref:Leukotoxin LktA family filamentous adhesin n=1 Tax=Thioclava arctica TaxID=3238301 RepID=A0ABV3TI87_9RHOB